MFWVAFKHFKTCLVIHKFDVGPVDGLALILGLLHLENVLIEVLLQLLVGQIDAELLEVVLLEALEACAGTRAGKSFHCLTLLLFQAELHACDGLLGLMMRNAQCVHCVHREKGMTICTP